MIKKENVVKVELVSSWQKKVEDLEGDEEVTLTFEQGKGENDEGVITTDMTVVLDEDSDDCPIV